MVHSAGDACDKGGGCVADSGGIVGRKGQFLAVCVLELHLLQRILLWFRGVQALQCRICGRRCCSTTSKALRTRPDLAVGLPAMRRLGAGSNIGLYSN